MHREAHSPGSTLSSSPPLSPATSPWRRRLGPGVAIPSHEAKGSPDSSPLLRPDSRSLLEKAQDASAPRSIDRLRAVVSAMGAGLDRTISKESSRDPEWALPGPREPSSSSSGPGRRTSKSMVFSEEKDAENIAPEHDVHYRYNRRLECSSHAVSVLRFTPDGAALVVGNGSGDVRIWDTKNWSKLARLQGKKDEAPLSVTISPSLRWLVCVFPSVVQVYQADTPSAAPVLSLPAPVVDGSLTKHNRWACAAFSPNSEVNHFQGRAGTDNYLALLSPGTLRVLDYAAGWRANMPGRSCSIIQDLRPTNLIFTSDGVWLILGFSGGQMQIWNASSLGLHKTLTAHTGPVTCMDSTPFMKNMATRILSCSVDKTLRLWDSFGGNFTLEQHLFDSGAADPGVRMCVFSGSARWALSVSYEVTLWRVVCASIMQLRQHQRFNASNYVEQPCAAAFCFTSDSIAMGLRDGTLCLWTSAPGAPPEARQLSMNDRPAGRGGSSGSNAPSYYTSKTPTGRPMQRIQPTSTQKLPDIQEMASTGTGSTGISRWMASRSISRDAIPQRQLRRAVTRVMQRDMSAPSLPEAPRSQATPCPASLGGGAVSPVSPVAVVRPLSRTTGSLPALSSPLTASSPDGGETSPTSPLSPTASTKLLKGQNRPLVKRIALQPQSIAN